MNRLSDTAIEIVNELHTERLDYDSEYLPLINALNKLAAYEDTGLEPEEAEACKVALMGKSIAEIKEIEALPLGRLKEIAKAYVEGRYIVMKKRERAGVDRLQEIAAADVEGRLVVLPYKIGDILYEIDDPEYGVIVCKVLWVDAYIGPAGHVEGNEQVNTFVCSIEVIEGHGLGSCYTFEPYDIGRTVFLTHEEAEAAMRKVLDDETNI